MEDVLSTAPENTAVQHYQNVLFEGMAVPAALLDDDLAVLYTNQEFVKVFGFCCRNEPGKILLDEFFERNERTQLLQLRNAMQFQKKTSLSGEFQMLLPKNGSRVFRLEMRRLQEQMLWSATFVDVSSYRQNARILQERIDSFSAVSQISSSLLASATLDEFFVAACKAGQKIMGFDAASLTLVDSLHNKVYQFASYLHGKISLNQGQRMTYAAFMQALANARDTGCDGGLQNNGGKPDDMLFPAPMADALVIPLEADGKVIGSFNIGSRYDNAFSPFHKEIFFQLAGQLAMAAKKAQLFQKIHESYTYLQRLAAKSWAINASLDSGMIAQHVCVSARDVLGGIAGAVQIFANHEITFATIVGRKNLPDFLLPRIKPLTIEQRLQSGKPIVLRYIWRSRHFSSAAQRYFSQNNIKSYLGVSAKTRSGKSILLSVYFDEENDFENGEKEIISTIAANVVMALDNADLHQGVKLNKEFLESILTSSVDTILCTDRDGKITFFSQGAENMLGYEMGKVLGKPIASLSIDGKQEVRKIARLIAKQGKILNYETQLLHKDGRSIPFSFSLSSMKSAMRRTKGFIGIGKDITEKIRAEEEIQQRSEELEDLVYLITHNLKTPIVSVEGFINLLFEDTEDELDSEKRHYLDRIYKNVEIMNEMISDLLEFSRFGKMELVFEWIDLQQVVDNLIAEFAVHYPEEVVKFEVARSLPRVYGNADGVKTVFENLLSNAAKYRNPDQPAIVRIAFDEFPKFFAFHVIDNGIGIEPEFRRKVFNLFQRGANVGSVEGTGVGLAICKRIIQKHGGLIHLSSTPGNGTTISFTLPKQQFAVEQTLEK